MSRNSAIEWCHHTVNLWWGCFPVSPACLHCYAEAWAKYASKGRATWGKEGKRWIRTEAAIAELRALEASAKRRGVRERVFINSMSDFFEDRRDLDAPRRSFLEIVRELEHLDLLLLTKRPENVLSWLREYTDHEVIFTGADFVASEWLAGRPPENVWLGTTVEDQTRADERIPELLRIPAVVRFLSCEPLLGPVDLFHVTYTVDGKKSALPVTGPGTGFEFLGGISYVQRMVDWVIVGGESGGGARPMHPDWARGLRDQCAAAGVPFHFKQWGEFVWRPTLGDSTGRPKHIFDDGVFVERVGKKEAGRLLDGVLHDGFPAVRPILNAESAEAQSWINIPMMTAAIVAAGWTYRKVRTIPRSGTGVAMVQFLGPWMKDGVPPAARCKYRHWIAVADGVLHWDVNWPEWAGARVWSLRAPELYPERCTGHEIAGIWAVEERTRGQGDAETRGKVVRA